jgi:hypothetical protein
MFGFLDKRNQAKMQWLQDPNHNNVDILNSIKHEARRQFRNKKKEYLEAEIDELGTNSKIRNIRNMYRTISDF